MRDFAGASICEAEPRFLLDELSSVNGLLGRFLKDVANGGAEPLSEAAIALVEEGGTRLPPLLEVHQRSLRFVARCEFAAQGAWPTLISRGNTLVADTHRRLETAPEEVRALRAAQALEAWHKELRAQQDSARRACPRRSAAPVVYFAWREAGRTTWLFCDGAQVTREGQQRPELEAAPEELARGRRPHEGAYLSATGRYPTGAVMAPPGESALTAW